MNVLRGACMLSAGVITTLWFVSLAVRATVGAPDAGALVAIGAVPTAPPSLRPLAIPARDPFAADAAFSPASALTAKVQGGPVFAPTASGGVGRQLATTNVPDVASLGGAAANVGIMATIVSDSEAYALVEEGGSVRVARAGDPLAGSVIAKITDKMVVLANGVRISLDANRAGSGAPSPSAASGGAPSPPPIASPVAPGGDRRVTSDGGPAGTDSIESASRAPRNPSTAAPSASTTGVSGYGRTVLTNPNGTPVQQSSTSGTLFPTVPATPTVMSPGSGPNQVLQPGGHP